MFLFGWPLHLLGFLLLLQGRLSLQEEDIEVVKRKAPLFENPELLHGDIVIGKRNAVTDDALLWPDGTIPYVIGPSQEEYTTKILEAMEQFHNKTCIRFVPRTHEEDYIYIKEGLGCSSMWGRQGGCQNVSLGHGCHDLGTIVHELNHAVGFNHEQNRSDRDEYIKVLWENILPDHINQFNKLSPSNNRLLTKFDYKSIMLYGPRSFSRDRSSPTIQALDPDAVLQEVYDKPGLSALDVVRINKLYDCKRAEKPEPPQPIPLKPPGSQFEDIFPPGSRDEDFVEMFKWLEKIQKWLMKDIFKPSNFNGFLTRKAKLLQ